MCQGYKNRQVMPNYEYIRTDNFLLPTTTTTMNEHQPKSMNDEYEHIRKECIQRSFKSTQSSIKSSSAASSSNANNVQSQILMGSSNTQRRRRSTDDNITNNSSTNNNNRLQSLNRRHSISNSSFVNSAQISNILQEHLLHSSTLDAEQQNSSTPQNVHDAINLELQQRNSRRGNAVQNRRRDSSTSPLPPTSELQRHLQRSSTIPSNQSASVRSQRRGSSRRSISGGGSLRDSNATILHSNQKRRSHQGGLRDSSVTILHSNQHRETLQNSSQLGSGSNSRPPKELVDSLQYSLDDSGKCNISLFLLFVNVVGFYCGRIGSLSSFESWQYKRRSGDC